MRFVTKLLALCTALIGTSGLATTIDFDTGIPPGCVASYTQDGVPWSASVWPVLASRAASNGRFFAITTPSGEASSS